VTDPELTTTEPFKTKRVPFDAGSVGDPRIASQRRQCIVVLDEHATLIGALRAWFSSAT